MSEAIETTSSETIETTQAPISEGDGIEPAEAAGAAEGKPGDGQGEAGDPKTLAKKIAEKVTGKLASRKARLREREVSLAQAREDFRRQQEALNEQARSIEHHRQLVARANEGDVEAMQELGWDYDRVTQALLKRNTPDEKIGALQKQLEAERKAREEREKRDQQAEIQARVRKTEQEFVSLVTGGEFPESALYEPEEIVAAGHIIADELTAKNGGRYPGPKAVAAELEKRIAKRHEKIRAVQKAAETEAAAKLDASKGKGKPGSQTLANKDGGDVAPKPPRPLTDEEKERAVREWVERNPSFLKQ
jgi:DNA repair exonuclease SbcCD ATPase subunit